MLPPNKLVLSMLLLGAPAWADKAAEVEYAVRQVLEQQGALFVSYDVDESGKINLLFGANEPEWRIRNTVEALQSRPEIPSGFFWTRIDAEFCAIR